MRAPWILRSWLLIALAPLMAGEPLPASAPAAAVTRLDAAPQAATATAPLVCWSETWETPRPVRFHLLRLDLRHPDYEVFTLVGQDPDGDGPAEATLESPLDLAARLQAVAAVNANAFRSLRSATKEELAKGWYAGKSVDIAGLAATDGAVRSLPDGPLPGFWFGRAGQVAAGRPDDLAVVHQGVSSWIDRLVVEGEIVARPATELHPRTLVGVDADRRYLLLVVADGRQKGYSEGISLPEAAAFMKDHGCRLATNLDGGGSSIMLAETATPEGTRLAIVNRPSGGRPRPIPVMLGVRRRPAAPALPVTPAPPAAP